MLPIPVLDDENFRDITDSARSMIPRIYPEWTDFNYHDPGITFLELFAFFKESQQYHMDQIGPKNREKYLKLLGMRRLSRSPARTTAVLEDTAGEGILPRGARLMAGTIPFETERAVDFRSGKLLDGFVWDGSRRAAFEVLPREIGRLHVELFGTEPEAGCACYFRFDRPWSLELPLALHFWLEEKYQRKYPEQDSFVPLAETVWEVLTQEGWTPTKTERDETRGFLFSGDVLLAPDVRPCSWDNAPESERAVLSREGFWLRVRMTGGSFDVAPAVTGVSAMSVPAAQKDTPASCRSYEARDGQFQEKSLAAIRDPFEVFGRTEQGCWRRLENVECSEGKDGAEFQIPGGFDGEVLLLLWRDEFQPGRCLEPGTGFPNQIRTLPCKGVLEKDFALLIQEPDSRDYTLWSPVEDFDSSGPEDRHYVLNEEDGTVRFGDCIHGMAPEGEILIAALAYTRGAEGSVRAGSIDRLHPGDLACCGLGDTGVGVWNPESAFGGRKRETDEECFARARKMLRQTDRAVTYEDFERLVRETPGLLISNCKAVPVTELPRQDGSLEENCVTVVVEPYTLRKERTLSPAYRENIRRWLESRRMLGTKIRLVQPEYIRITVYGEIISEPHYTDARERICRAVEEFFRSGWKFGTPVRYSELYGIIDTLDCVRGIESLTVDAQGKNIKRSVNGDVKLPYNGLAVLNEAEFQVRAGD